MYAENDDVKNSGIVDHESYQAYEGVWDFIDDCVEGEAVIKSKRETYLSKTEGMASDPKYGEAIYARYLRNAQFPEYTYDYLSAVNGMLRQKDPTVNVPEKIEKEYLISPTDEANKTFMDIYGEVIDDVIRYSRCGILLDPPETMEMKADLFPNMIKYGTRSIRNWGYSIFNGRKIPTMILLDESYTSYENESLSAETVEKFRFLGLKIKDVYYDSEGNLRETYLKEPLYYTYVGDRFTRAIFNPPAPNADGFAEVDGTEIRYPRLNGSYSHSIPFFCFGSTEMSLYPEKPLAYPICKGCLYLYGLNADFREYLYKTGFGIYFANGVDSDKDIYVGTNKVCVVSSDKADLKLVESNGVGLSEYRLAIQNTVDYIKSLGLSILKNAGDESGTSVGKRISLRTSNLKSISKTIAEGFTQIIKKAAEWNGNIPQEGEEGIDSISIVPVTEFHNSPQLSDLISISSTAGADKVILSDYDIYLNLRAQNFTPVTTFDEWNMARKKTQDEKDARDLAMKKAELQMQKDIEYESLKKKTLLDAEINKSKPEESAEINAKNKIEKDVN